LQTNSTTLCFVGLVNPREIRMQLYQWGNGMPRKILRLPVVLDRTGLSRSTVYLRVTEGRFPRPVSLGARAVGWIETEVEEWIARQIEVSREIRAQRTVVSPLSSR
jgi:prophage regulatory protein